MGLGDKVKKTLREWGEETADVLTLPLEKAVAWGVTRFLESFEGDLISLLRPALENLRDNEETPDIIKPIIDDVLSGKHQVGAMLGAGAAGALLSAPLMALLSPFLEKLRQASTYVIRPSRLSYEHSTLSLFRGVADEAWFESNLSFLGFLPEDMDRIKAVMRYLLGDQDLRNAYLRGEIDEAKYHEKLKARGYAEDDADILAKLAWALPSVQDLIHMAVREVFTPEIAERYGQFEDYPADFTKWAEKIGLSKEWATNHWAAHWALPSATQGFEMFHRGVIGIDDLRVLLRALDVMPYWRDKLVEIAYTPYTRVDVRRMHKLGILDREQVKRAYLDQGYNEERAENMTRFTEEYNADPEPSERTESDERAVKNRDLTTSQVTAGYRKGLFTEEEARSSLEALGYKPAEADFYIALEDLKKEQDRKSDLTTNYRQLYVTGVIDRSQVRRDLSGLNYADAEVDQLLELWELERLRRVERPTRADLDRFIKAGIIDAETYRAEMKELGFADRYIDWYASYVERD